VKTAGFRADISDISEICIASNNNQQKETDRTYFQKVGQL
jgi:hypothetical protein